MPDHVHILVSCSPEYSPREIAQTLKSVSAVTMFTKHPTLKKRNFWGSGMWSRSTYYGSVGNTDLETIKEYVKNQKQK